MSYFVCSLVDKATLDYQYSSAADKIIINNVLFREILRISDNGHIIGGKSCSWESNASWFDFIYFHAIVLERENVGYSGSVFPFLLGEEFKCSGIERSPRLFSCVHIRNSYLSWLVDYRRRHNSAHRSDPGSSALTGIVQLHINDNYGEYSHCRANNTRKSHPIRKAGYFVGGKGDYALAIGLLGYLVGLFGANIL